MDGPAFFLCQCNVSSQFITSIKSGPYHLVHKIQTKQEIRVLEQQTKICQKVWQSVACITTGATPCPAKFRQQTARQSPYRQSKGCTTPVQCSVQCVSWVLYCVEWCDHEQSVTPADYRQQTAPRLVWQWVVEFSLDCSVQEQGCTMCKL